MKNTEWKGISIAEIRRRTGMKHDQVVAMIREGWRNKTCRSRTIELDGCQIPTHEFDFELPVVSTEPNSEVQNQSDLEISI